MGNFTNDILIYEFAKLSLEDKRECLKDLYVYGNMFIGQIITNGENHYHRVSPLNIVIKKEKGKVTVEEINKDVKKTQEEKDREEFEEGKEKFLRWLGEFIRDLPLPLQILIGGIVGAGLVAFAYIMSFVAAGV